jgi:hypothetical protein
MVPIRCRQIDNSSRIRASQVSFYFLRNEYENVLRCDGRGIVERWPNLRPIAFSGRRTGRGAGAGEKFCEPVYCWIIRHCLTAGFLFTHQERARGWCDPIHQLSSRGVKPGVGKATYESYLQSDGSGSFRSPGVLKRTGEINLKPLKGFHPFAFQLGNYKIKVGEWSFSSSDPRSLDMGPFWKKEKDFGYEFASTSAQSIDEIDASDKRLRWFRYDTETKVVLPVADLPK